LALVFGGLLLGRGGLLPFLCFWEPFIASGLIAAWLLVFRRYMVHEPAVRHLDISIVNVVTQTYDVYSSSESTYDCVALRVLSITHKV
jgi:hypothetical protein